MSHVEIDRDAGFLIIRDDKDRAIGVSVTPASGEVMFSVPTGRPGRVSRLLQCERSAARAFAKEILELLGEDDH